jgi:hypothetical protein
MEYRIWPGLFVVMPVSLNLALVISQDVTRPGSGPKALCPDRIRRLNA